MIIDNLVLNELTLKAKNSPRKRFSLDLRTSPNESSQRMLNAIEPETHFKIHRHLYSTETVTCIRGYFQEIFYNNQGFAIKIIDMRPGLVINIPVKQWHCINSLESGTILLSFKDGRYAPLSEDEIW